MYVYIYIYIYTHTYIHTHTHKHIHIYINTHTNTHIYIYIHTYTVKVEPSGRAVWGVGVRTLASWDCGFESRRGHRSFPLVSVVCRQVGVNAKGWSLVQSSATDCGVSECDCEVTNYEAVRQVRPSLLWDVARRRFVVIYRRFSYRWDRIGSPETSVINY